MTQLEFDYLGRDNIHVNTVYDHYEDKQFSILKLKLDNITIDESRIKKVKVIIDYWDTTPTKKQYKDNLYTNLQMSIFKQVHDEGLMSDEDYQRHMELATR
jgi:hypothetical protein